MTSQIVPFTFKVSVSISCMYIICLCVDMCGGELPFLRLLSVCYASQQKQNVIKCSWLMIVSGKKTAAVVQWPMYLTYCERVHT
jgi:hypothetical protein